MRADAVVLRIEVVDAVGCVAAVLVRAAAVVELVVVAVGGPVVGAVGVVHGIGVCRIREVDVAVAGITAATPVARRTGIGHGAGLAGRVGLTQCIGTAVHVRRAGSPAGISQATERTAANLSGVDAGTRTRTVVSRVEGIVGAILPVADNRRVPVAASTGAAASTVIAAGVDTLLRTVVERVGTFRGIDTCAGTVADHTDTAVIVGVGEVGVVGTLTHVVGDVARHACTAAGLVAADTVGTMIGSTLGVCVAGFSVGLLRDAQAGVAVVGGATVRAVGAIGPAGVAGTPVRTA